MKSHNSASEKPTNDSCSGDFFSEYFDASIPFMQTKQVLAHINATV